MRLRIVWACWLGLLLACSGGSGEDDESSGGGGKRPGGKAGSSGAGQAGSSTNFPVGGSAGAGGSAQAGSGGSAQAGSGPAGCAPGVCYVPPPAGWEGPFAVSVQGYATPEPPLAACAGGAVERGYASPGGPAQCAPCACGGGAATCTSRLRCYLGSTSCGGNPFEVSAAVQAGCYHDEALLKGGSTMSCQASAEAQGCAPQGGQPTLPPAWSSVVDSCPLAGPPQTCPDGSACTTEVPAGSRLCIRSATEASCPPGWAASSYDTASTFTDGRGCSACSCGGGSSCSPPSFRVYDDNICTENPTNIAKPITLTPADGCRDVSPWMDTNNWGMKLIQGSSPSGGGCTASGGAPEGSVAPGGTRRLYCCI